MEKKSVVNQIQPVQADIVTKPDVGKIDPSTGISESLIKTGNVFGFEKTEEAEKKEYKGTMEESSQ